MAQGDLTYNVSISNTKLDATQIQALISLLNTGLWDGQLNEIQSVVIDKRDSGIYMSINGERKAQPESVPFPVHVKSREE